MIMSKSSALSVSILLIFYMHDQNGALFSNATLFSAFSDSFAASTKILS